MRVFLAGARGVIGAEPVVCDVFDADGVRAAMADASPEAVIHQVTALRGASNAKGKREFGWRSLGRPDRGRARGFPHGGCGGGP